MMMIMQLMLLIIRSSTHLFIIDNRTSERTEERYFVPVERLGCFIRTEMVLESAVVFLFFERTSYCILDVDVRMKYVTRK